MYIREFKGPRACVHICKHPEILSLTPTPSQQVLLALLSEPVLCLLSISTAPAQPSYSISPWTISPWMQCQRHHWSYCCPFCPTYSLFSGVVVRWSSANVMGLLKSSHGSQCICHRTRRPCFAWERLHGLLFFLRPPLWLSHVLTVPATLVFSLVL